VVVLLQHLLYLDRDCVSKKRSDQSFSSFFGLPSAFVASFSTMGNTDAKPLPASFPVVASYDPSQILPRDVLLLVLKHVISLRDFAACLRVCRLFYNYLNREEAWLAVLAVHVDEQFPGRSEWIGYQLKPIFMEAEWAPYRSDAIALGPSMSRRALFKSKEVMRQRFDLYSGWGSLLQHHFVEGYFHQGSLVLGTLYEMQCDKPRIVYTGFLYKGKRHGGLGVSYYPDGSVCYKGPWVMDEQHGQGRTFWKNGSLQYSGQFRHGRKEGVGTQVWATGTYEGEWSNDMPHGNGCILFYAEPPLTASGSKPLACIEYQGEWSDDLLNGPGKRFAKNGTLRYEGQFVCGLKQGLGRSYAKNGRLSYEGEYVAGKKQGVGKLFANGALVYEGEFVRGLCHGTGCRPGEEESEFRNGLRVSRSSALDDSFNAAAAAAANTSDDEHEETVQS
jgi:antitoxin component YwqK of YwqJK toxin-antitoxin module